MNRETKQYFWSFFTAKKVTIKVFEEVVKQHGTAADLLCVLSNMVVYSIHKVCMIMGYDEKQMYKDFYDILKFHRKVTTELIDDMGKEKEMKGHVGTELGKICETISFDKPNA